MVKLGSIAILGVSTALGVNILEMEKSKQSSVSKQELDENFSIKEILSQSEQFTQEQFNKLFIRPDGFNHILYTDV